MGTHNARFWLRVHLALMVFWIVPMTAFAWWVVYKVPDPHASFAILLVSNYANMVSHWGAWQAARSEKASGG